MVRVVLLLALVACSKDGGPSCRIGSTCEEFSAAKPEAQHDCEAVKGQWVKAACPTDNLVGTCTTSAGEKRLYYGGGTDAYTPDNAAANCEHELHGTWAVKK